MSTCVCLSEDDGGGESIEVGIWNEGDHRQDVDVLVENGGKKDYEERRKKERKKERNLMYDKGVTMSSDYNC